MLKAFGKPFVLLTLVTVAMSVPTHTHAKDQIKQYKASYSETSTDRDAPAPIPDVDFEFLRDAATRYTSPEAVDSIPKEVLIEDFINVALSDHDWLEGLDERLYLAAQIHFKLELSRFPAYHQHEWARDYFTKHSHRGRLVKRTRDIIVGLGYPKVFILGEPSTGSERLTSDKYKSLQEEIKNIVARNADEIKKTTGLSIHSEMGGWESSYNPSGEHIKFSRRHW